MDVMWDVSDPTLTGAERSRIEVTADGWLLTGVVVAAYDGRPLDVDYQVLVDAGWATRSVDVTMDRLAKPRRLRLDRSTNALWRIDGAPAPELDGCLDVDLGVTPSTNTLPIRRLGLKVGQELEIDVAWVKFPELRVDRGRQTYARISAETWRYTSGEYTADLTVDENGCVTRYGNDLWKQVPLSQ